MAAAVGADCGLGKISSRERLGIVAIVIAGHGGEYDCVSSKRGLSRIVASAEGSIDGKIHGLEMKMGNSDKQIFGIDSSIDLVSLRWKARLKARIKEPLSQY